MDLRQLETFVRVAELGSFTRASIVLAAAQPALSKQIRRLEVELGQTLFSRHGRGIVPTEEGTLLLEHARGIIDQVGRARRALNAGRETPHGKVVIATPAVTGTAMTAGIITTFRQRFPKASLEIIEGKSRFITEWLLSGRIDIAILYDPPASPLLEITPLMSHELSLFSLTGKTLAPKGRALPFRELAGLPLILPGHPHSIRTLVETEATRAGIQLNVVLEVDGASFILELVQLGHGYTILPDFSLRRSGFAKTLQLNEITTPRLKRSLKVAVSTQRPVTRLTRETVKLVRQYLGPGSEFGKR
jgi:LysR family nitrogen assimilation transcriptional regulator